MPILLLAGQPVVTPPLVTIVGDVYPTAKLELSVSDPNQPAVWVDISAYLDQDGITLNRGRNSELDRFQAGSATFTLNNNTGTFDPTFSGSPFYPNLRPQNRLRYSETWNGITYPQIVGYVEGWVPVYPGGTKSVVPVRLVDGFSVLALAKLTQVPPFDPAAATNLLDNASAEDDLDQYGANAGTLTQSNTFAKFGLYAVQLHTTNVDNSNVHYSRDSNVGVVPGRTYTASLYARLGAAVGPKTFNFRIDFYNGNSFLSVASKDVTLPAPGTDWLRFFVVGTAPANTDRAEITISTKGPQGVFDLYTDGWQFEQLQANLAELPEERADLRIGRLLDAIGWPVADRSLSQGASLLLEQTGLDNSPALDALQLLEKSENGRLWMDRNGAVKFLSRWDPGLPPYTTPQAVFGPDPNLTYEDITFSNDATQVRNDVRLTGTQPNAVEQVAQDATSLGRHFQRTLQESGLLVSDNTLADAAAYELARYKDPQLRFTSLVVNGLSNPTVLWPSLLTLQLSDRVTIRFAPPGAGSIVQDCFIEGIKFERRRSSFRITYSLSSFGIGYQIYPPGHGFFILSDPTYGAVTSGPGVLVY